MANDLSYVYEKFRNALYDLIYWKQVTGDLKERLERAYSRHLIHLKDEWLPGEEAREIFQRLRVEMTDIPAEGNEGSIAATLQRMNEQTAKEQVIRIVDLFEIVVESKSAK